MSLGFQIVGSEVKMIKHKNNKTNKISAAIYNCFVVHRNRFWIKKNKSTQL